MEEGRGGKKGERTDATEASVTAHAFHAGHAAHTSHATHAAHGVVIWGGVLLVFVDPLRSLVSEHLSKEALILSREEGKAP